MPTIKLQSSDGETFPVEVEIARQSVTIRTMLEDLGMYPFLYLKKTSNLFFFDQLYFHEKCRRQLLFLRPKL